MNQSRTAAGELITDRQGSVVEVDQPSVMCYFHPETEALVFISEEEATTLENHSNEMIMKVDEMHAAESIYQKMIDHYARASEKSGMAKLEEEDLVSQVSAAEKDLEEKREKVREALGDYAKTGMGYADVVELIPAGTRQGRPYSYVTRNYFDTAGRENRLRSVSLRARDSQTGQESFYRVDRNGRRTIDTNALMKQITSLKVSPLKLELKDVLAWAGVEKVLEDLNKDVTLFEWAESWNESLVGHKEINEHLDVSGGAQFMRFISNVGASAEYDPASGKVAIKAESSSSLTLASGKAGFTRYVPDRMGWSLIYKRSNGNDFDMGRLRVAMSGELAGFIGGSVVLGGQLQIVTKDDQQLLAGQAGRRLPRFSSIQTRNSAFYRQMAAEDEGLEISGEAFAGLKVEGSLKGAVQWLKPADPPDVNAPGKTKESSGEYVDFCTISPSIAGLAGVGAGTQFHCTFINGKFCFRFAASLCWGAGAKGGLICEVNANHILEFGGWLSYQLYTLNYGFFDLISKDAFEVFTKYCVMRIGGAKKDIYSVYNRAQVSASEIADEFTSFVDRVVKESEDLMSKSKRRNEMAENVVANKLMLLSSTPEAKAALLYMLTRHGKVDDLDYENYGYFIDRHRVRKEAVVCILWSIQTRAEWDKVMCRVTKDGRESKSSDSIRVTVDKQERSLVEFLKIGLDRDDEVVRRKEEFEKVRDGLKEKPVKGYALSMNNSMFYRLNTCDNQNFPRACDFGPNQWEVSV